MFGIAGSAHILMRFTVTNAQEAQVGVLRPASSPFFNVIAIMGLCAISWWAPTRTVFSRAAWSAAS